MLLLLRVRLEHAPTALAPFECAGFCLVGLRTAVPTGDALIALRWHAEANNTDVIAQLCEAARAQLPAGVALSITASQEDALEQMRAHFGPREVVQWAADPADPSRRAEPPLGDALQHAGAPWLEEVLRAAPGSSGAGAAFVRRLRRDGYAPLLLTASQAALWREVPPPQPVPPRPSPPPPAPPRHAPPPSPRPSSPLPSGGGVRGDMVRPVDRSQARAGGRLRPH
jgi:hypothetical protein